MWNGFYKNCRKQENCKYENLSVNKFYSKKHRGGGNELAVSDNHILKVFICFTVKLLYNVILTL